MSETPAVRVETLEGLPKHPGAYMKQDEWGMYFSCPGCGTIRQIVFEGIPEPVAGRWGGKFDGNWDSPTLSPSVLCQGCCGWHGFLRAGVWQSC